MYALVALLSMVVAATFALAFVAAPARAGCPAFARRARAARSTPTTGGCSSASGTVVALVAALAARADRARALLRDALLGLRR